ncbi:hypothetical protein [Bacillus thuringiensis]|uniref:hypothetical protein n=1 Tax=Bacillus thuringiensis TaxID=1428 RepID=UPI00114606C6|nr:hypothetical protein [Bacillus thuringiensis]
MLKHLKLPFQVMKNGSLIVVQVLETSNVPIRRRKYLINKPSNYVKFDGKYSTRKDAKSDIVNVAIDELIKHSDELPAFQTLRIQLLGGFYLFLIN